MFKQNKLSTAIVAVLASVAGANQAVAQDAPAVEEVIVTGIRASVQAAMDVKRDAAGVVDAISAEDIGKFPDTNLAESLQRITGVSIDRTNGEGSLITVRGFGPDFNMVTLNGRTMPVGSAYGGSSGADAATRGGNSRAFDFANLASEAVSGVEVYKTGKANITTGGIGATVNIKTTRPLDRPGFVATVGAKAVMDTTNRTGSDVTPELSGLVSWSDDEGKMGVSLSASVQERDSGYTGATVNEWHLGVWGADYNKGDNNSLFNRSFDDPLFDDANKPADGQIYSRPNDIRYSFSDSQRTRTNAQLTLQFAPTDEITTTLDYTLAVNEREEHRGELTNWVQNGGNIAAIMFDDSAIATPIMIREEYDGTVDIGMSQQYRSQEDTLDSIGFNVEWLVNDQFTMTLDVHDSSMESLPTGPGHSGELDIGLGAPVKSGKTLYWNSGLPAFSYVNADPLSDGDYIDDGGVAGANPNNEVDPGDISSTVMRVWSAEQVSDVTQIKLDGSFEFDEGRFDFGIERREMSSNTTSYNGGNEQVLGGWGASAPGEFDEGLIEAFNVTGEFEDWNTGPSPAIGFRADARELAAELVDMYSGDAYMAYVGVENTERLNEDGEIVGRNTKSSDTVEEDTTAVYFQFSLNGNVGPFETTVLAGLRYEATDQTSISNTPPVSSFNWTSNDDFFGMFPPGVEATITPNDYDALLPSFDFSANFTDDIVGRFSYSKTIARAGLANLTSAVTGFSVGGSTLLSAVPTADAQNPLLVPLESSNYDVSVEWYFDDTSYASFGLFEKRVINFVGSEQLDRTFGILDQTSGPLARQAQDALEEGGYGVDNDSLYTMMIILGNPGEFPDGAAEYDDSGAQQQALGENCTAAAYCNLVPQGNEEEMVFLTSTPINNEEAKVYGAEMAVQHFFGDTGFGVMANYTIVRSDVGFDNLRSPNADNTNQFALPGLSDTANLVLMYEDYGVQARLAYNWRDEFLTETSKGSSSNPRYVEAYSQIDLNVSYAVMDGLDVFFEGINITGEDRRDHARNEVMMWGLEDLGPRYQVGARYAF